MSRTDAILKRLLALHPQKLIDLKLDRIVRLLEALGRPQDRLPPVIHVAGTNAKGSTIALMRAMLEAAGQRVHVYTSPHLVFFRERVRLAGKLVSARRLNAALERCEIANAGEPITYFEITTAAALLLFSEIEADYLLLEVGLGGRFDATNVIDRPLGAVITPISFDHQDFLGDTLAKIAGEKAGILKKNSPAVIGRQPEEALAALFEQAQKLGISPYCAGTDFDGYAQNGRLVYQDGNGLLDLPPPALAGPFQFDNATLAIAALRHFGCPMPEAAIAQGLRTVQWPGRMMPIKQGKLRALLPPDRQLWLDGGHNEAGAGVLSEAVRALGTSDARPTNLVFATFANKDAGAFLDRFKGLVETVVTLDMKGDRASWPAAELAELARQRGFAAMPARDLKAAILQAAKPDRARIVICGSLHLAGDVLAQNGTPPQ